MAILKAQELYSSVEKNTEIAISGTQDFAVSQSATANKNKYGSMNTLLVVNRSAVAIRVTLDGNTFAELSSGQSLTIDVEDGIFFNLIRITNLDAGAVVASDSLTIRYGKVLITGAF